VRDDLQAERERRTGDSERFREALAKLRESAEEALAVEQSANSQLGSDLREAQAALEKMDADLKTLRGQLEAAGSALTEAEAKAEAEAEALRKRVAKLESDGGKETERLRAELEKARGVVDEARDDAERLIARLTAVSAK
jgi:HPt (histidine-containing phosphotransfer) domain-containing protein